MGLKGANALVTVAVRAAQVGYAGYGVVDGFANGRPFSAGVAVGMLAYGFANGGQQASGRGADTDNPSSGPLRKPDKVIVTAGSKKEYPNVHEAMDSLRDDVMAQPPADRASGEYFSEVYDVGNGRFSYKPLRYYACRATCEGQWSWNDATELLAHSHPADGTESDIDKATIARFVVPEQ
jgi:hypothetical protein